MTSINTQISSAGGFNPAQFKRPSDSDILKKLEQDFGKDAANSVKGKDGKVDFTKLQSFLQSKGIQPPQGGPPGVGGADSAGTNQDALNKLIDNLTKEFGKDETKNVKNDDGSVNFDELKKLLDKKHAQHGGAHAAQGAQGANSLQSIVDLLYKKDDKKDDESGGILNATL